jgi:hypothetical protein
VIRKIFSKLKQNDGIIITEGKKVDKNFIFEVNLKVQLPQSYLSLLELSNGITAYYGYFRLLGDSLNITYSIDEWNQSKFWKFSWQGRCDNYICFGETAFGDQYAFSIDDLASGNERVFFLDCLGMTSQIIAPDFITFFQDDFLRNAKKPYDNLLIEAFLKFGKLKFTEHLIYSPSPLISGEESIANLQILAARTAMIFNGDVATQIDNATEEQKIREIKVYHDQDGNERIKLEWC